MVQLIKKTINPLRVLMNDTRTVGVLLILCTVASLLIVNLSSLSVSYLHIWSMEFHYPNYIHLPHSFSEWINNFLMAFFFLMAGMEIKRELVSGELSSFKKAALPFGAAIGGMLVPALIFIAFNLHTSYINGWGIPTATDIAFSVGIASLLGKRIPVGLKILLMALAIIDDLGAIVVIALFYGGQINWMFLGLAGVLYSAIFALNHAKIKFGFAQILLSLAMWYLVFNSGVEASIVGVLVAFATPVSELPKIENAIHRYVNFLILPLFALANTAILLPNNLISSMTSSIGMGIMIGLVIGKPVGIYLFSRILVALKVAVLPTNVQWKQIFGMGTLAGIGFTMSIFTTNLAFSDVLLQDIAKVSIIASVVLSLVFSLVYFTIISMKFEYSIDEKSSSSKSDLELKLD